MQGEQFISSKYREYHKFLYVEKGYLLSRNPSGFLKIIFPCGCFKMVYS